MVGNKHSGRRPNDGLPHGGGRPRRRLIVNIPTSIIVQLQEIAAVEGCDELDVVREAILSYIERWQVAHDG